MAGQGPAVQLGEAEGVIDFIIKRAKQIQSRDFVGDPDKSGNGIRIEELAPLFFGAPDSGHHMNRIRYKMRDEFRKAKITFRCRGSYYEFNLDPSINIDISAERKAKRKKIIKKKTSTKFDEEFIAPPWFSDLLDTLEYGDKPILVGPQGCGKSRALEEAFAHLGRDIFRIALGEYRDPADLIGTKEIVDVDGVSTTKLVGGPLTEAMEKGCGVIMDELDICPPALLAALNKIMERGVEMVLPTEKGVVKFRPHENTLIAATANTWGYGDDTGMFAGSQMQNRASWDRLRPKMECNYDYAIERRLVASYLPVKVVEALYSEDPAPNKRGIIRKIREAIQDRNNPLEDTLGLRSIIWFAQRWQIFGWHKGMHYILNDFREENREPIAKIITDRFGKNFAPSRNDYDKNGPNYIPNMMPSLVTSGFGN